MNWLTAEDQNWSRRRGRLRKLTRILIVVHYSISRATPRRIFSFPPPAAAMCSRALLTLFTIATLGVSDLGALFNFDEGGQIYFPDQEIPHTINASLIPARLETKVSKSVQMCQKYAAQCVQLDRFGSQGSDEDYDAEPLIENGTIAPNKKLPDLIVNGTDADPLEFPHMALIGYESRLGIQWKCGGSLISEEFVLSAAHCNARKPKRVRFGDYNIQSTDDDEFGYSKPEEFIISQIIQHPEYNESRSFNDITLYKLDRPVVFNKFIRPICLHTEFEIPVSFGILSGWGGIEYGGPSANILRKGNVSFVSMQECKEALNPSLLERQSEIKDEMMVCAANYEFGTDACQGDSGGPLQYRLNGSCTYIQTGIVSFGVKCGNYYGQPKYPAVYTRVSNYIPWIEGIVWPPSPT